MDFINMTDEQLAKIIMDKQNSFQVRYEAAGVLEDRRMMEYREIYGINPEGCKIT